MNPVQQKANAKKFVERWQNEPGNEEEQSRSFWIQLLEEVLGIQNATHVLQFERKVKGRKIDVFYEDMGILIEQKGRGISLDEATVRSKKAGPETPYQQACWYANNLPFSIRPRWIITCNFDEIRIYDQDQEDTDHYETVLLGNLPEESYRLSFFTDKKHSRIEQEKQLSVQAGEIVGKLYNQLSAQYKNIETDKHEQYSLNVLIVRLVFLLYAEDAGLLQRKDAFLDYMKQFDSSQMRTAFINLFEVLNTPEDKRDPYLSEDLLEFPYINGDLYSNKANITIPQFTEQIRLDLLLEASQKFDWKKISPTIFGAVFESTLNPETRRAGGMHYTSVENIHKVIDPLFLNELTKELEEIEGEKVEKNRKIMLQAFQKKLASLNIFDPACGSGNFLTESYLSLRKLENRVIESLQGDQISFDIDTDSIIQVSISQFYGIEINDFAVSVAKTALWIAEEQMMEATQEVVVAPFHFLPLKSNSSIVEGNALRMDWNDVLPAEKCAYICGNPPFIGGKLMNKEQRQEIVDLYGKKTKLVNSIDYVSGWYYKASEYLTEEANAAFVSTNSICQGQQVSPVWKTLVQRFGIFINFAWKTFIWDSEAISKAHVHVVIIGFSKKEKSPKFLFSKDEISQCRQINGYLFDAPSVYVETSAIPISKNVPNCDYGSLVNDKGYYTFAPEELETFLSKEPSAKKYIRPYVGSTEFINNKKRYILYLAKAKEEDIAAMPYVKERVQNVINFRKSSTAAATVKSANRPLTFFYDSTCSTNYLLIPRTSSERRIYIPIGFMDPSVVASDATAIVPCANLYHFGIATSTFHNAWMRTVAGRLKSDYRYAPKTVWNTFPWPNETKESIKKITDCASMILKAREAHQGDTLAQMYDGISPMPKNPTASDKKKYSLDKYNDLLEAHLTLDKAVEEAYGVDFNGDEEKIVAHLFKLYAEMTKE